MNGMAQALTGQAGFTLRGRNPDVLTCIANLSNDEVFTPPEFANRMLDTLAEAWAASHDGANLWADKTVKFLDPCTKSGVFLREITSRLTKGLADEIPDLQSRVDHILTKQVFGIGITLLTSLLARRSVYCSKHANGAHSIAKSFTSDAGNIWFERTEHTWANGKCTFCGASQSALDRGAGLETHAYAFIHTDDIKTRVAELFGGDMQFDVIIGKLTTGVTVPQWSSILMLRNLKSPETYFQAAFRVQSPWSIKNPNGDNPNEEEIHRRTAPECKVHLQLFRAFVADDGANLASLLCAQHPMGNPVLRPDHERAAMKFEYDPIEDALYVRLSDSKIIESEQVQPGIILDFDEAGEVAGIEVLSVSKRTRPVPIKQAA